MKDKINERVGVVTENGKICKNEEENEMSRPKRDPWTPSRSICLFVLAHLLKGDDLNNVSLV